MSLAIHNSNQSSTLLRRYWALITAVFIVGGFSLYNDGLAFIVPLLLGGGVGIYGLVFYPRIVMGLLFFCIPISAEIELPGGLSTDLPGEPIMWALTLLSVVLIAAKGITKQLWNSVTFIIIIQLIWMVIAALFASNPMFSIKFILAKSWYILPLFILPCYLIRDKKDIHQLLDLFIAGVCCGAAYFFINHGAEGFDFDARVTAGKPIWRNHVNYACTLVCTLPVLFYRFQSVQKRKWHYIIITFFILTAVYFAYARVAYLCMIAALGYVLMVRLRLTKPAIVIALIAISIISYQTITDEAYVKYAPEYEKAITQDDFGSKVGTTFNGKDISTMERVHRWVAGIRMIEERPLTGFGPSNFYTTYKPYTVYSFETYVSDNPEHSGIHNYYLMTIVEQGWVGLLLLLSLLITALLKLEKIYHRVTSPDARRLALMVGSILIMIVTINLINDMMEVIKIGALFYFCLFLIARMEEETMLKKGSML